MGKSKNNKFKRPQFNSAGLPVGAVKGVEEEHEEEDHADADCPAAELLEKVGKSTLEIPMQKACFC